MQKNLGSMVKGIAQLQARMDAVQKEIAAASFDGDAANGLVRATINGKGELQRVHLDPSVMTEDAETVADLVTVAFRKAFDAKEEFSKGKLAGIASGLLPMGMKLPGMG